eukprot:gene9535-1765_t
MTSTLPQEFLPQTCAILEDAVDQLAVLGALMPAKTTDVNDSFIDTIAGEEVARIISEQRELEAEMSNSLKVLFSNDAVVLQLLDEHAQLEQTEDIAALDENEKALRRVAEALKTSTILLCKNLKTKQGSLDNIMKIHDDRKFVLQVLEQTIDQLLHDGSYKMLFDNVSKEQEENNAVTEIIQRERKSRDAIKHLKAEIVRMQEQKEVDIRERNELIAQLKDQKQEARVRTQMETDYIERSAQVGIQMANKRKDLKKAELLETISKIQQQLRDEHRVHSELETFLKRSHAKLTAQLDEWSEKFDQDNETKQQELDKLRDVRAQDLVKLQDLTETYNEYERVITKDRKQKQKLQDAAQRSVRELAAAIRIQAWWRGVLVRHKLDVQQDSVTRTDSMSGVSHHSSKLRVIVNGENEIIRHMPHMPHMPHSATVPRKSKRGRWIVDLQQCAEKPVECVRVVYCGRSGWPLFWAGTAFSAVE